MKYVDIVQSFLNMCHYGGCFFDPPLTLYVDQI